MTDPNAIARSLSEAQRRAITGCQKSGVCWLLPYAVDGKRVQENTQWSLADAGLLERSQPCTRTWPDMLSNLGLEVRRILLEGKDNDGS